MQFDARITVDERETTKIVLDIVSVAENNGLKLPREFGLLLKQVHLFDLKCHHMSDETVGPVLRPLPEAFGADDGPSEGFSRSQQSAGRNGVLAAGDIHQRKKNRNRCRENQRGLMIRWMRNFKTILTVGMLFHFAVPGSVRGPLNAAIVAIEF